MKVPELTRILADMMESTNFRASDLNFTVDRHPQMEVDGNLIPAISLGVLTRERVDEIVELVIGNDECSRRELVETGACDCSFALPGDIRFRVNVFRTQGRHSIVMRVLPSDIPTVERLGLPDSLLAIPKLVNGLVLVTGATGSGKSTTLAALIGAINRERPVHIVTLEDPIEFKHPHLKGTVNQRELGQDFQSYASGLRAALRQSPKVLMIGEMRDRETVEIALKAAETGHLVMSSLHTLDAGQTIERVLGMFDHDEARLVRGRLAQTLKFIVCQRLVPRTRGNRVAAVEIMGMNLRIRDLVLNGESTDRRFRDVIADSRASGWQTFDQHLGDLYRAGIVDAEVAKTWASDRAVVTGQIDQARAARGESTSELGELEMDHVRPIGGR